MKDRLLPWLLYGILRLLYGTVRLELQDSVDYFKPVARRPYLVAAWHNRILLLPPFFRAHRRGQRLAVLTSASRDGGLLAAVVQKFGLEVVRGSSSRRGSTALRELQGKLADGCDVIITPDGPRGPVYEISPGIVFLAAQTGLPILRLAVEYSRFWELKSWDRFRIPKPFSKVVITVEVAKPVGSLETDEALKEACAQLANELHSTASVERMPAL
jgi:lysophospholipid acyltransferase (LPLAT)-like uncharacterized protein